MCVCVWMCVNEPCLCVNPFLRMILSLSCAPHFGESFFPASVVVVSRIVFDHSCIHIEHGSMSPRQQQMDRLQARKRVCDTKTIQSHTHTHTLMHLLTTAMGGDVVGLRTWFSHRQPHQSQHQAPVVSCADEFPSRAITTQSRAYLVCMLRLDLLRKNVTQRRLGTAKNKKKMETVDTGN